MNDVTVMARRNRLEEAIQDLDEAESIEEIVQIIRISARAVAGADGITVVRREDDFVHYVAEDAVSPLWTGQRFPIQSCVSGIAMLTCQPVLIPDVFADPRVPHYAYEPTFVKSMAMFPLGAREKLVAIGAYWSRAGQIDTDTIDLLTALAKATEDAIEKLSAASHMASQPKPGARHLRMVNGNGRPA